MIAEPFFTVAEVAAVRALIADKTHEVALRWIMTDLCLALDNVYRPGEEGRRDTDFELGRQFVGITIGSMTRETTMAKARANEKKGRQPVESLKPRGK